MAANYLDIKSLLELSCAKTASLIKDKSVPEIRKFFNIENDFSPEEEAFCCFKGVARSQRGPPFTLLFLSLSLHYAKEKDDVISVSFSSSPSHKERNELFEFGSRRSI